MGNIIGPVTRPNLSFYNQTAGRIEGLSLFLSFAARSLILLSGVYALFNLILAGYAFLSAADDPKKIQGASSRVLHSLLGILFATGSVVMAAIFGKIIFNDWGYLLQFRVFTP